MSNVGTELKINVHVEPIDGFHMSDYDFVCRFYIYRSCVVDVTKQNMIRIDNDNYIACVDSGKLGFGTIMMRVTAQIPDSDFQDGLRTEIKTVSTGITIG